MRFLTLTCVASAFVTIAAIWWPDLSDWLLLSVPVLLASLFLLIWGRSRQKTPRKQVVIDGSNVMYWHDNTPKLATLRVVVRQLGAQGYSVGAIFDANAGYLLTGKYEDDGAMAKLLGLPENRVVVVAKGTPADPVILKAAHDLGAQIVTNDRYRDWIDIHPEIKTAGHLVKGGYQEGKLWLENIR